MSNPADTNKSKRRPLGHLNNATTESVDSQLLTENSVSKSFLGSDKLGKGNSNSVNKAAISVFEQEDEYVKTLKKALKEAMDENSQLRNRVMELEALFSCAQDEIEKKDQAILELADALDKQQGKQKQDMLIDLDQSPKKLSESPKKSRSRSC